MNAQVRTALFAVAGITFMTGLAWASVPLYRMFCQVTGLNGTTQRGEQAPGGVNDRIRIDFDANVSPSLKWKFAPELPSETVDIGARLQVGRVDGMRTDLVGDVAKNRVAFPQHEVTVLEAGDRGVRIKLAVGIAALLALEVVDMHTLILGAH